MLVRKFHHRSDEVKVSLFGAYCTSMYAAPLWVSYKKETLRKLQVAYNDCLRILLKKPRSSSASKLFCDSGLRTLQALLRNLMFKFMSRLDESQNCIIMLLTGPRFSSVRYESHFWKHWYGCLLRLWTVCLYMFPFLFDVVCLTVGPRACNKVYIYLSI